MSFNEDANYKPLLVIGNISSVLGSAAIIVGLLLSLGFFSGSFNLFGLVIIALAAGIFIVSLLSFFGTISPSGFAINDERGTLFTLAIFLLSPIVIISKYTTPVNFLLALGNSELTDNGTLSVGMIIALIGAIVLFLAFVILSLVFFWEHRFLSADISLYSANGNPVIKTLRIVTSILVIASGIFIILGMFLTIDSAGDFNYLTGNLGHLDLEALLYIIKIGSAVVIALLLLLTNIGILRAPKNEVPLLGFIMIPIFLPGWTPTALQTSFWTTPIYEQLLSLNEILNDTGSELTTFGWITLISILVFILTFFLAGGTLIFSFSSTMTTGTIGGTTRRRRRKKTPQSPPSAESSLDDVTSSAIGAPPSGDLASQLSGQETAAGQQPKVSSEPPSPPSFMASSGPPSAAAPAEQEEEKPTCPFCGKELRWIQEYSRWYCDSCQQYV
ncbi:MAG: hypothetical protein U9O98_10040 [Asgard group archaeon]|nr:hypothetical protein [Asgard group archaeon]